MKRKESLAAQLAAARSEKRRLIAMSVGLGVVVAAFLFARHDASEKRSEARPDVPVEASAVEERVVAPQIDGAALGALVADGTPADRVVLERPAVDAGMAIARNLGPAHFAALGAVQLDAERVQELLAAPSAARGEAFSARGWIEALRTRRPVEGRAPEHHGTLVLEDDAVVYFVADRVDEGLVEGDFARVDGLFLKAFNDESRAEPGTWIQGPLLVSPRVQRSYADLGTVAELPPGALLDVRDDDLKDITGIPVRPFWTLMALARDGDHDAVAWDEAEELDKQSVVEMLQDGARWRGRPFRLPPSQVMGIWVRRPGENPARMDEITEGWIGNWTWPKDAPVIRFASPLPLPDVREKDLVTGTGWFLKNIAYEPASGQLRTASMVVLDRVEPFEPVPDTSVRTIMLLVSGGVVSLVLFLWVLLRRDRRRSEEMARKLVERKQRRRRELGEGGAKTPPAAR